MSATKAGNALTATRLNFERAVELVTDRIEGWLEAITASLPNLFAAIFVFLLFYGVARLVRRTSASVLARTPMHPPLRRILASSAGIVILVAGSFIALGILGLDKTVTSLLAGVGIVGLALGFAFQQIASDYIAGFIIAWRRPYRLGDLVKLQDELGLVHQINLRTTALRLLTGEIARLPNRDVIGNPIINFTVSGRRRVDIPVGVTYGEDLPQVREVTENALRTVELRDQNQDPEVFFTEFGDSAINLIARFWIDTTPQADYLAARSEAIIAIKKSYDANGITIPFPIRTLDFGPVGGRTLVETLEASRSAAQPGHAGIAPEPPAPSQSS
ncbi:MAG: mechanosensitive ion channel family protein [Thermoanaerobaculia bacterium]